MGLAWATFRININSNGEETHRDSVGCFRRPDWKHAVLGHMCTFYIPPIDLFANKTRVKRGRYTPRVLISLLKNKAGGRKRVRGGKKERRKRLKVRFQVLMNSNVPMCWQMMQRGLGRFILWTALLHSWQGRMRRGCCEISVKFQWLLHIFTNRAGAAIQLRLHPLTYEEIR